MNFGTEILSLRGLIELPSLALFHCVGSGPSLRILNVRSEEVLVISIARHCVAMDISSW